MAAKLSFVVSGAGVAAPAAGRNCAHHCLASLVDQVSTVPHADRAAATSAAVAGRSPGVFAKHFNSTASSSAEIGCPRRCEDYIEAVTPMFRKITGRAPKGVPIVVPVAVEAMDKELRRAHLSHTFLIELPKAYVVNRLTKPNDKFDNPFGEQPRNDPNNRQTKPPAGAADRQQKLADVNTELGINFARRIRRENPSKAVDPKRLDREATAAKKASDEMLAPYVEAARKARFQQLRMWADRKGHVTHGRLKSVFADQVDLTLSTGRDVTVAVSRLSDADQAYLDASQKPDTVTDHDRTIGRMQFLLDAIGRYVRRKEAYPPAWIVDEKGKPLLSWRVALLPELGAKELYELFHFDEAWNSAHNQKLLEYMPDVFKSLGDKTPSDHTQFVCFALPGSVMRGGHPLSPREVKDPLDTVVMLGEASAAVPWTQPEEMQQKDLSGHSHLARNRGQFLVGVAKGIVRTLPTKMDLRSWESAVNCADGNPAGLEFGDPSDATPVQIEPPPAKAAEAQDAKSKANGPNQPPVVEQQDADDAFKAPADAEKGQVVGLIGIRDPDGDQLTATISSGNNHGAFELDPVKGAAVALKVANPAALQKLAGLEPRAITVLVADGHGNQVKVTVRVVVRAAVEESPKPPVTGSPRSKRPHSMISGRTSTRRRARRC